MGGVGPRAGTAGGGTAGGAAGGDRPAANRGGGANRGGLRLSDLARVARKIRALPARVRGEVDVDTLVGLGLTLGEGVYLAPWVLIDYVAAYLITIDDGAVLAPRVHVLAHDASTRGPLGYTRLAPVYIGKHTFIGAGTLVLPGSSIGERSIVGAGSLVTGDVPAGVLAKGRPAKVVGSTEEFLERRARSVQKARESGLVFELAERMSPQGRERIRKLVEEAGEGYIR